MLPLVRINIGCKQDLANGRLKSFFVVVALIINVSMTQVILELKMKIGLVSSRVVVSGSTHKLVN